MTAIDPDTYAATIRWLVEAHDTTKDRALLTDAGHLGMSSLRCREQARRVLLQTPASDSPPKWAAIVGTAIDEQFEAALKAAPETKGWLFKQTVTAKLPSGFEITGTCDWADPAEPSVTDLKGLSLDTKIPTPTGWTTMGDLSVGDQVFGSDGRPCNVVAKSEVKYLPTYVVKFSDGTQVVCDAEHYWWVYDQSSWIPVGETSRRPRVVGIEKIKDRVRLHGLTQYAVPVTEPLELPDADLPIHPYVLGAWLGDGASAEAAITIGDDDAPEMIGRLNALGMNLSRPYRCGNAATYLMGRKSSVRNGGTGQMCANDSLRSRLKAIDVFKNKHIPAIYLRASHTQRLQLLQGLMDTDGTWNRARNRAAFITTSKAIASGVMELLVSLGQRPQEDWRERSGFGVKVWACGIEFTPLDINPFQMTRKAELVVVGPKKRARASRRTIASVTPGPDVPTACIAVDSPNATYLCSEAMIPTHNSKAGLALARKHWASETGYRLQRHLLYLGLIQNHGFPEDGIVRNIVVDRSGKDPHPFTWQEPFSMDVVREADEWLEDVTYAIRNKEEAAKDVAGAACVYCPFWTACRGGEIESGPITTPQLAELVDLYGDADLEAKTANAVRDELREAILGVTGHTQRYQITTTKVATNGSQRVMVRAR